MKKIFLFSGCMLLLLGMNGIVKAELVTIGTATYNGANYNLIWDDNNNGNSVIWLDYTRSHATWANQTSWAAGLDSALTYNIDAPYIVDWVDGSWRLPSVVDGAYEWGYDGTTTAGYNITTSEFGHLYYVELGNLGYKTTWGSNQLGYGLNNTGDFNNFIENDYWAGTRLASDPDQVWIQELTTGAQNMTPIYNPNKYAMAIRSGVVSTAAPVPEPGTLLLFGSGLIGLAGVSRKKMSK